MDTLARVRSKASVAPSRMCAVDSKCALWGGAYFPWFDPGIVGSNKVLGHVGERGKLQFAYVMRTQKKRGNRRNL